jgi:hypothetical protein
VIKEAVKMFDVITSDKKTQELLRLKEKGKRDFNSAMRNSKIEGRKEEKVETALSMLADGMSVAVVSKYTGLLISEIELLRAR